MFHTSVTSSNHRVPIEARATGLSQRPSLCTFEAVRSSPPARSCFFISLTDRFYYYFCLCGGAPAVLSCLVAMLCTRRFSFEFFHNESKSAPFTALINNSAFDGLFALLVLVGACIWLVLVETIGFTRSTVYYRFNSLGCSTVTHRERTVLIFSI